MWPSLMGVIFRYRDSFLKNKFRLTEDAHQTEFFLSLRELCLT